MKLKTKLVLFNTIGFLLFLFVIETLIYFSFVQIMTSQEIDRIEAQATTLLEAFAQDEISNVDPVQLFKAYVPTDGMIRLIDDDGQIIQVITQDERLTTLDGQFTNQTSTDEFTIDDGERFAKVSMPIIYVDQEVKALEVVQPLKYIDDALDVLILVLIFSFFMMIIPGVFIGQAIARIIIKPIERLSLAMQHNQADGKWEKVEFSDRKDELGHMALNFNEMNSRLKSMFDTQEQFVANASHELKTPLAVIKSYVRLMERQGKTNPDVMEESLETINYETDRMHHLIQQMLTLVSIEKGELFTFRQVALRPLLKQASKSIALAFDRTITFEMTEQDITIVGDEEKLKQLVYILLDNAQKYSEKAIRLSLKKTETDAVIEVKDYGEGLSKQDQQAIFDRFYRVDKARARETGGTGLGLTIAKAIVDQHEGRIEVDSTLGEGTTFRIFLPL
ncbi:hypothetical protein SAMN05421839_10858 [Halolactibacillus halophilus]|uniref:Signal transduction histidine-protein kinase ArlS n=1 Tax=Halolactibacillus halophilus TaxID=306540 RepID=A0A1I5NAF1_9BACI|nr:HAMP domain-containing histidine kinase [Halolactibacillus halophilus]GEM01162.1 sensor histidine kinase YkoH [Halolactibacillus halophilus]SFP18672.1 hypothetical protein SAMN05421839_10858 [Halolactibacillus halophilus]